MSKTYEITATMELHDIITTIEAVKMFFEKYKNEKK